MPRSQFNVMGFTLKLRFRSISPEPFEIFSKKLWSNVYLSETVCRAHDSATVTQGQGHTSRSWDLPLNFESAPYLLEASRYLMNPLNDFHQIFSLRRCAEPLTRLRRLKGKATVQGHEIYP